MSTELVTLDAPELQSLEPSKAEQIRNTFVPMADMLSSFEGDFNEIMALAETDVTPELSARARRLRLDIAKVRIAAEKARVKIKAEYLTATKAIDGTNNVLKWAISQKEEALESIEKHAERMEAERVAALQAERVEALTPYVEGADERDLGSMDEDVWAAYLAAKKQEHADRIEAERVAEETRKEEERIRALDVKRTREAAPFFDFIPEASRDGMGALTDDEYAALLTAAREAKAAHEAEQAAARKERDRLAKEAEKKEAARKAELAKIEAERKKEREAAEAERKRREELEAAERDRLAKEKAEAEARKKAEAEAAKAPTRKRLAAWVESFTLPDLPGDDHEAADRIREKFAAFQAWAKKEAGNV